MPANVGRPPEKAAPAKPNGVCSAEVGDAAEVKRASGVSWCPFWMRRLKERHINMRERNEPQWNRP